MKTEEFVSFQGVPGSYSHMACMTYLSKYTPLPCTTFEEALHAVEEERATYALLPVENSTAGRVADLHQLLPKINLFVVGEHYQPIEHCLLGLPDAELKDLKMVYSHMQALSQCQENIKELGLIQTIYVDTAAAAQLVSDKKDKTHAAIASKLAAQMYDLKIFKDDMRDEDHNTTRFLLFGSAHDAPSISEARHCKTALFFQVRSIPAALFKALGGFATSGVNLSKIESYVTGQNFETAQFYIEIEGHAEDVKVQLALEELRFYSERVRILGTFISHTPEDLKQNIA